MTLAQVHPPGRDGIRQTLVEQEQRLHSSRHPHGRGGTPQPRGKCGAGVVIKVPYNTRESLATAAG